MAASPQNRPDQDQQQTDEQTGEGDAPAGDTDEETKGGARRSGDMRRADTANGEGPDTGS